MVVLWACCGLSVLHHRSRELSKAVVAQLIPEGEATLADTRKQAMITAFRSCGDNLNLSSVKAYFAKLGVALSNAV
jgi:hypothetical protein